jgi:hypothetical protein
MEMQNKTQNQPNPKRKVHDNFKNFNSKVYHRWVYAYKGTWVFGKYPFLYLPHGSSMGIYKNYIPMMGMSF